MVLRYRMAGKTLVNHRPASVRSRASVA